MAVCHSRSRRVALAIIAVVAVSLSQLTGRAQQPASAARSIADSRGCKALLAVDPGMTLTSTVPCVDGWFEGNGAAQGKRNGITELLINAQPESGLIFKQGRLVLSVDSDAFPVEITGCGQYGQSIRAGGVMRVPDSLAAHDPILSRSLVSSGMRKIKAACPSVRVGGRSYPLSHASLFVASDSVLQKVAAKALEVHLLKPQQFVLYCQNGRMPDSRDFSVSFRGDESRSPQDVVCLEDYRWQPAVREQEARIRSIATEEQAEAQQKVNAARKAEADRVAREQALRAAGQEQNRRAEADRIANERQKRLTDIRTRFGPFTVVTIEEITPNPFAWQGKVVATCTAFERMLDPSTARFGAVYSAVVTGVPTTRYQRAASNQFLVARVTGQAGGYPLLQYLTSLDGGGFNCAAFVP